MFKMLLINKLCLSLALVQSLILNRLFRRKINAHLLRRGAGQWSRKLENKRAAHQELRCKNVITNFSTAKLSSSRYNQSLRDDSFIQCQKTQASVIMAKSGLLSLVNNQILKCHTKNNIQTTNGQHSIIDSFDYTSLQTITMAKSQ